MNTHIPRHKQPLPLLFFGGGDETQVDGSKYNPTVIQFLRDDWIHTQMQQRCVLGACVFVLEAISPPRRFTHAPAIPFPSRPPHLPQGGRVHRVPPGARAGGHVER